MLNENLPTLVSWKASFPPIEDVYDPGAKENSNDEETDLKILGGFIQDGQLAWQSMGPYLRAVSTKDGIIRTSIQFGASIHDDSAQVSCAIELPESRLSVENPCSNFPPLLIVGVESDLTGGYVHVYHIGTCKILRSIHFKEKVTALTLIHCNPNEISPLPPLLKDMSGILAVGTLSGRTYIIDLRRKDILKAISSPPKTVKNELNYCNVQLINPQEDSTEFIEEQIQLCKRNENHIGFILNAKREKDLDFHSSCYEDSTYVSKMLYIPETTTLVIGFNFSGFQLWDVAAFQLLFSSRGLKHKMPVRGIGFLDPTDDPTEVCYLWVVYNSSFEEAKSKNNLPFGCIFNCTYETKQYVPNYGNYFENFLSINKSFEMDLSGSLGIEGHLISCQTINKITPSPKISFLPQSDNRDEGLTLDLFMMVFELWSTNGTNKTTQMVLFDLNQWYKAQFPKCGRPDLGFSYMSINEIKHDLDSSLLAVHIDKNSVEQFAQLINVEQYFFPSALSFDFLVLSSNQCTSMHHPGAQRFVLKKIENEGPNALLRPNHLYNLCLNVSLKPFLVDLAVEHNELSTAEQRNFVLSIALEYGLIKCIADCVTSWADGRHCVAGCTLPALIQWAWERVFLIKGYADRLCVPLFDFSGTKLDSNGLRSLEHCRAQMVKALQVFKYIQTNHSNDLMAISLDDRINALERVCEYYYALMWFLNSGLLPEHSTMTLVDPHSKDDKLVVLSNVMTSLNKKCSAKRIELKRLLSKFKQEYEQYLKDVHSLYLIDCFITEDKGGSNLISQWERESNGSSLGHYPPMALQYLLRIFFIHGVEYSTKTGIIFYFLLDICDMIEKKNPSCAAITNRLMNFCYGFGVKGYVKHMIHAMWHIDHQNFEEGIDILLENEGCKNMIKVWLHRAILRVLLFRNEAKLALKYLQIMKPPLAESQDVLFHLNTLLTNGLLSQAFLFQRKYASHQTDLLLRFFDGCERLGQLKNILNFPLSVSEEELFTQYLERSKSKQADDLRVFYLLSRGRYTEAVDVNTQLKGLRNNVSSLAPVNNKQSASTRDIIVGAISKTLPNITRQLSAFCSQQRNTVNSMKQVERPTPLSMTVHTGSSLKSLPALPYYKSTNEALIQSAVCKTRETWSSLLATPAPSKAQGLRSTVEVTPFLRTPKTISRTNDSLTMFDSCQTPVGKTQYSKRRAESPLETDVIASTKRFKTNSNKNISRGVEEKPANVTQDLAVEAMMLLQTPVVQRKVTPVSTIPAGRSTPLSILKGSSNHTPKRSAQNKSVSYQVTPDVCGLKSEKQVDSAAVPEKSAVRQIRFSFPNESDEEKSASKPTSKVKTSEKQPKKKVSLAPVCKLDEENDDGASPVTRFKKAKQMIQVTPRRPLRGEKQDSLVENVTPETPSKKLEKGSRVDVDQYEDEEEVSDDGKVSDGEYNAQTEDRVKSISDEENIEDVPMDVDEIESESENNVALNFNAQSRTSGDKTTSEIYKLEGKSDDENDDSFIDKKNQLNTGNNGEDNENKSIITVKNTMSREKIIAVGSISGNENIKSNESIADDENISGSESIIAIENISSSESIIAIENISSSESIINIKNITSSRNIVGSESKVDNDASAKITAASKIEADESEAHNEGNEDVVYHEKNIDRLTITHKIEDDDDEINIIDDVEDESEHDESEVGESEENESEDVEIEGNEIKCDEDEDEDDESEGDEIEENESEENDDQSEEGVDVYDIEVNNVNREDNKSDEQTEKKSDEGKSGNGICVPSELHSEKDLDNKEVILNKSRIENHFISSKEPTISEQSNKENAQSNSIDHLHYPTSCESAQVSSSNIDLSEKGSKSINEISLEETKNKKMSEEEEIKISNQNTPIINDVTFLVNPTNHSSAQISDPTCASKKLTQEMNQSKNLEIPISTAMHSLEKNSSNAQIPDTTYTLAKSALELDESKNCVVSDPVLTSLRPVETETNPAEKHDKSSVKDYSDDSDVEEIEIIDDSSSEELERTRAGRFKDHGTYEDDYSDNEMYEDETDNEIDDESNSDANEENVWNVLRESNNESNDGYYNKGDKKDTKAVKLASRNTNDSEKGNESIEEMHSDGEDKKRADVDISAQNAVNNDECVSNDEDAEISLMEISSEDQSFEIHHDQSKPNRSNEAEKDDINPLNHSERNQEFSRDLLTKNQKDHKMNEKCIHEGDIQVRSESIPSSEKLVPVGKENLIIDEKSTNENVEVISDTPKKEVFEDNPELNVSTSNRNVSKFIGLMKSTEISAQNSSNVYPNKETGSVSVNKSNLKTDLSLEPVKSEKCLLAPVNNELNHIERRAHLEVKEAKKTNISMEAKISDICSEVLESSKSEKPSAEQKESKIYLKEDETSNVNISKIEMNTHCSVENGSQELVMPLKDDGLCQNVKNVNKNISPEKTQESEPTKIIKEITNEVLTRVEDEPQNEEKIIEDKVVHSAEETPESDPQSSSQKHLTEENRLNVDGGNQTVLVSRADSVKEVFNSLNSSPSSPISFEKNSSVMEFSVLEASEEQLSNTNKSSVQNLSDVASPGSSKNADSLMLNKKNVKSRRSSKIYKSASMDLLPTSSPSVIGESSKSQALREKRKSVQQRRTLKLGALHSSLDEISELPESESDQLPDTTEELHPISESNSKSSNRRLSLQPATKEGLTKFIQNSIGTKEQPPLKKRKSRLSILPSSLDQIHEVAESELESMRVETEAPIFQNLTSKRSSSVSELNVKPTRHSSFIRTRSADNFDSSKLSKDLDQSVNLSSKQVKRRRSMVKSSSLKRPRVSASFNTRSNCTNYNFKELDVEFSDESLIEESSLVSEKPEIKVSVLATEKSEFKDNVDEKTLSDEHNKSQQAVKEGEDLNESIASRVSRRRTGRQSVESVISSQDVEIPNLDDSLVNQVSPQSSIRTRASSIESIPETITSDAGSTASKGSQKYRRKSILKRTTPLYTARELRKSSVRHHYAKLDIIDSEEEFSDQTVDFNETLENQKNAEINSHVSEPPTKNDKKIKEVKSKRKQNDTSKSKQKSSRSIKKNHQTSDEEEEERQIEDKTSSRRTTRSSSTPVKMLYNDKINPKNSANSWNKSLKSSNVENTKGRNNTKLKGSKSVSDYESDGTHSSSSVRLSRGNSVPPLNSSNHVEHDRYASNRRLTRHQNNMMKSIELKNSPVPNSPMTRSRRISEMSDNS